MSLSGENIVFGYHKKPLVVPFSFSVESGKIIALIGLNGSGKTTFFKTLMGGVPLLSGTIKWEGRDLKDLSFAERHKIFSWLPARKVIEERLKVFEILTFSISSDSFREDVLSQMDEVIRLLNLEEFLELPYHLLSEGQKKKVEIAALLMKKSPVILFDEPSVFLDVSNQLELVKVIKNLSLEKGKTIFISSHNLDFLRACADVCWEISDTNIFIDKDIQSAFARYFDK
ncbi:MAG: ABC transporter ATP-binding protein [Bacteroidetes bacterium]|nr:ABC transporter ATP-binding protein [Bacteroidota bacterium]